MPPFFSWNILSLVSEKKLERRIFASKSATLVTTSTHVKYHGVRRILGQPTTRLQQKVSTQSHRTKHSSIDLFSPVLSQRPKVGTLFHTEDYH